MGKESAISFWGYLTAPFFLSVAVSRLYGIRDLFNQKGDMPQGSAFVNWKTTTFSKMVYLT